MKPFFCTKNLLLSALILLNSVRLSAQWNSNTALNTAVSLATGDKFAPSVVSDDSGGAIIVWRDSRNGNFDIYAQRLDISGVAVWKTDGIPISTLSTAQQSPVIASDGKGGAIIVWDNFGQVAAQRVNARGVVQWATNGVPVTANAGAKYYPQVVSDDSGGAIIVWEDGRNWSRDVYAQRLNGAGVPQWTLHGIGISMAAGSQRSPKVIADGSGGVVIAWQDYRSGGTDVYAQKVSRQGQALWQADGALVCNANNGQGLPELISDDSGGAIIAWNDSRNGKDDIYAQRMAVSGNALWTSNGVLICDAYDNQYQPNLAVDGKGGAIIAWGDYRTSFHLDIYAQRVDARGKVLWTKNGIAVCTVSDRQFDQKIISDGKGGAIIAWEDYRNGIDIYGQHITASGQALWAADGIALSDASASQYIPVVCSDQNGGMILSWHDNRNTRTDIFAQNVCFNGVPGYTSTRGPFNTTLAQNLKICKGNTTKLSVSGAGTISWYSADTGGVYLSGGSEYITPLLYSTSTFYAQDSNACGIGNTRTAIRVLVSQPSDSTLTHFACNTYVWQNRVLTVSGVYRDTVLNAGACDSVITLNLSIHTIDTAVVKTNNTLQARETDAGYQWIDCTTKQWLPNDTFRDFTPEKSGVYAVIIRKNNCEDTSSCHTLNPVSGLHKLQNPGFRFQPNPADAVLHLSIENGIAQTELTVFDMSGRLVLSQEFTRAGIHTIDVEALQNGVYLMQLRHNGSVFYEKVLVQH